MALPEYQLIDRAGADHARVSFRGAWQAPEVEWLVDLITLARYRQQHPAFTPAYGERTALMSIPSLEATPRTATVALPLARIGDADILKAVIMLRNYRRLREGVSQWSA